MAIVVAASGKRRRIEIQRLRTEHGACRAERGEWVAARTVWLRLTARLREERRAMAVRAFAVEKWRAESAKDPVAAKRLERLERQWFTQCEATANDLDRLQATLKAEAAQLDERSRQLRHDVVASEARTAVLDNRAAEIEREEQVVAAERERSAGDLDAARARQEIAEAKTAAARDEAERLARLLIDAGPQAAAADSSQAHRRVEPRNTRNEEKNESVLLFISEFHGSILSYSRGGRRKLPSACPAASYFSASIQR